MAAAIKYLMETSNAYDGFFIVGPQKDRVGVVRALLGMCSDPLHSMLISSGMKEEGDIEIPDVHIDAVNILLKYAYGAADSRTLCDELTGWSGETALHVVYLADKYLIYPLKEMALAQLVPTGVDDVFPALQCLITFNDEMLETPVLEIIEKETEKVLAHPDFVNINIESLTFILKQDTLNVTEVELWKAVLAWAKHKGGTEDPVTVREILRGPLRHIRLYVLETEEFWEHVEPTKILTLEEMHEYNKAVWSKEYTAMELFSNNTSNRMLTLKSIDLAHKNGTQNEKLSSYYLKLKKAIWLKSLVCHGHHRVRKGNANRNTVTVTVSKIANGVTLSSARFTHTSEFNCNEDVIITPQDWGQGLGDKLMADCEYLLEVKFSRLQPAMYSAKKCCDEPCNHDYDNEPCYLNVDDNYSLYRKCCDGHKFEAGRLDCLSPYCSHLKQITFTC